jgi:hypothetical protein
MVIAPSGKIILNFTNGFNQFFEAGQAFRGESARCEPSRQCPSSRFITAIIAFEAMSSAHSIAPPLFIIVWPSIFADRFFSIEMENL